MWVTHGDTNIPPICNRILKQPPKRYVCAKRVILYMWRKWRCVVFLFICACDVMYRWVTYDDGWNPISDEPPPDLLSNFAAAAVATTPATSLSTTRNTAAGPLSHTYGNGDDEKHRNGSGVDGASVSPASVSSGELATGSISSSMRADGRNPNSPLLRAHTVPADPSPLVASPHNSANFSSQSATNTLSRRVPHSRARATSDQLPAPASTSSSGAHSIESSATSRTAADKSSSPATTGTDGDGGSSPRRRRPSTGGDKYRRCIIQ